MGRFYKATPGQFIDNKMYETPFAEMALVIGKADADIEKNEDEVLALQDTLKLQSLKADSPEAKAKIAEYEAQIGELVQGIYDEPLKYRRKTADIRNLSRTIQKDFESGEAYNIQTNYDTRQKNLADMQSAWQKNPDLFNYEDIDKLMTINDDKYRGFKTGKYSTDMLKSYEDIDDVEELAKGYKPETSETLGAFESNGKLYTRKDFKEEVSADMIRDDILLNLQQDDKLNGYYQQQVELDNITADEYLALQESTADRLAAKYGYKKTSKGLTSIKNDSRSVAQFSYDLNNPLTNTTPGSIYDDPLSSKYNVSESTDGIKSALVIMNEGQELVFSTLTSLLEKNTIPITEAMSIGLANGDFSVLKGVNSEITGKPISNAVLLSEQKKWNALEFDKQIYAKRLTIAESKDNPDAYLKEISRVPSILESEGDFQALGLVHKDQSKNFNSHIKEWRDELNETRGWHSAPLKFDAKQIKNLPPELQTVLKDGTSVQDLINGGVIKIKYKGDIIAVPGSEVYDVYTEAGIPTNTIEKSDEYQNFSVNGSKAKPMLGLDGSGNVTTQFEISINGNSIRVYMNEKELSNGTITKFMDKNMMKAAHKYNEAVSEGVINEDDFYIDGINFTKTGGQTFANDGTKTLKEAFQGMAIKYKNDETKMLK